MSNTAEKDPFTPRKKAKHTCNVARHAWDLFQQVLNDDTGSFFDELLAFVRASSCDIQPCDQPLSDISSNVDDCLGILASVVYYQAASNAIGDYLERRHPRDLELAQTHIDQSLAYFSRNASCRAMGANFGRVTGTLSNEAVTAWYRQAVEDAHCVRKETLQGMDEEYEDESVKEWMELLLLNQVCGVEYTGSDDEEKEHDNHQDNEQEEFSASPVEGTSRFMMAMLLSRDGHHDDALQQLKRFPDLTHRLHPNVWMGRSPDVRPVARTKEPVCFQNVLPASLYNDMCRVFGPDAMFWKESDYTHRGFYSFLMEVVPNTKSKNLIDDVVLNHLLPLAQGYLGASGEEICAYEWWVHSRHASLGHMLHFDTDEANLKQASTVNHPILSSVLHLTGNETSGSTIILDQTPDSTENANVCWRSVPRPNSFMLFNGNLLHGVLPCSTTIAKVPNMLSVGDHETDSAPQWVTAPSQSSRRLTFMVGFKTRSVPDQRRGQTHYGPCAPLPMQAEWVKEIHCRYNGGDTSTDSHRRELFGSEKLPCVLPAWECIVKDDTKKDREPILQLPSSIDQRFFVSGAPECFRRTLFENDDDE